MSQQQLPLFYKNQRPTGPGGKSQVRCREFQLVVVLLLTFVLVWVGLVSYMPEVGEPSTQFDDAYRQFTGYPDSRKELGSTDFTPLQEPNQGEQKVPVAFVNDRTGTPIKLDGSQSKVPVEYLNEGTMNAVNDGKDKSTGDSNGDSKTQEKDKIPVEYLESSDNNAVGTVNLAPRTNKPAANNDSVTEQRRAKVVEMIKHAWNGYVKYAFGENELKPISKRGHSPVVFGKTKVGATIVDSLDTLYIVGLREEFQRARDWVSENLNMDQVTTDVSLFEFNIRFIGGLLSSYALTGDEMFKEKAVQILEKLLPAFKTPTGLPKSLVNVKTGQIKNWGWASGGCSILSEVGSLHLEFQYLTHLTGNRDYLDKANHIRNKLHSMNKPDGLYPNYINPNTGNWGQKYVSLGALGDSFYEYLIKSWLITSKEDTQGQEMFYEALGPLESRSFQHSSKGLLVVSDMRNGRADGKMQHLACFSGGMFVLASQHATNGLGAHYLDVAKDITRTCHESYQLTATKLGPEAFRIDGNGNLKSRNNEKMYLLRPETLESYFYLWRHTHDPIYREWGWEVVQALEANCRVDNGYSGIKDVYNSGAPKDDVQQSFFVAEALKYLYLLFSDDSVISLDSWVFNTEAHPFPILPGIPRPVDNDKWIGTNRTLQ